MWLEAVNPWRPEEICVARITQVKGRILWLRLEGTVHTPYIRRPYVYGTHTYTHPQIFRHTQAHSFIHAYTVLHTRTTTVVQEVEKLFSNQKVSSSIPCRSVLEQDTEPLIAPDVQCAISVNVNVYTL